MGSGGGGIAGGGGCGGGCGIGAAAGTQSTSPAVDRKGGVNAVMMIDDKVKKPGAEGGRRGARLQRLVRQ